MLKDYELAKILVQRSEVKLPPGEHVRLSSGKKSDFYFDCQRTTRFAEAMPLIGRAFIRKFREHGIQPKSVGGLAQGADPIAQAIAHTSLMEAEFGPKIDSFSVRKVQKTHGTQQWIEGGTEPGTPVAIVDDVITTGGSVIQAIEKCRESSLNILMVVVLVDREEERGRSNIEQALGDSVPVEAIFTKSSLDEQRRRDRGDGTYSGVDR